MHGGKTEIIQLELSKWFAIFFSEPPYTITKSYRSYTRKSLLVSVVFLDSCRPPTIHFTIMDKVFKQQNLFIIEDGMRNKEIEW